MPEDFKHGEGWLKACVGCVPATQSGKRHSTMVSAVGFDPTDTGSNPVAADLNLVGEWLNRQKGNNADITGFARKTGVAVKFKGSAYKAENP